MVEVAGQELVEHAALAPTDVVPRPRLSGGSGVREPADAAERVVDGDVAVAIARAAAVAADDDVLVAVGIDVGELDCRHGVRSEVADGVGQPRRGDIDRLLEPREADGRGGHDVEAPVTVQVGVVEVEPAGLGVGDAERVFAELRRAGGDVLEIHQPGLAARAADDVEVAIAVEIDGFGVLRHAVGAEHGLAPAVRVQRVAHDGEQRDGRLAGEVVGAGVLRALVRCHGLGCAVVVEIGEEHADVGSAALGHRQDQALPTCRAWLVAGILQVDQVREFGCDDHIGRAVAVDVGDGRVFGGRRIGTLGERHVVPAPRIICGEGDPHMPVGRAGVLRV